MSETVLASDAAKSELDLESLEIDILVIAKNVGVLNSCGNFLSRRGWPTKVVGTVAAAIEYVAEKKPDFVLISLSHSSPAVLKLPAILQSTFNTTCIGFVESVDSTSTTRLEQSKFPHKISGLPTGPNVQRTLRRILVEKFGIKNSEAQSTETSTDSTDAGAIRIKGGMSAKNPTLVQGGRLSLKSLQGFQAADKGIAEAERLKARVYEGDPDLQDAEREEQIRAREKISLFEKATQVAILRVCRPLAGQAQSVGVIDRVLAFTIVSPDYCGYLLLAWPAKEKMPLDFVNSLERNLMLAFQEMGVSARAHTGLFIPVPRVEFETWVSSAALFQFSGVHQNNKIRMAFVPAVNVGLGYDLSSDKKMLTFALEDLTTDVPLTFNAYLYFKENKKYFLYLREGRHLQEKQKNKLKDNQIQNLFARRTDAERLRAFLTTSSLRETIPEDPF